MKTSSDNGATWSGLLPVATGTADTWGNPTPVYQPAVDPSDGGTIFLFCQHTTATGPSDLTHDNRRVMLAKHTVNSDGVPQGPWTITDMNSLKPGAYAGDSVGPGNGIRLTRGASAGALVIPARDRNIYSTDRGATWKLSTIADPGGVAGGTEGTVTEREDGSVYRNDRGYAVQDPDRSQGHDYDEYRRFTTGTLTGGYAAWQYHDGTHDTLTEPADYLGLGGANPASGSQGSTARYNFASSDGPGRVMFVHPSDPTYRRNMRIWISYDDGTTWDAMSRAIPSPTGWASQSNPPVQGGYSSLTKTSDFNLAVLTEATIDDTPSNKNDYLDNTGLIVFHKFDLAWIVNGRSEPT